MTNINNETTKGPAFLPFIIPIINVLKDIGGSSSISEVTDKVIQELKISDKELSETLKNGESRIKNQIAWARMYLVNAGYIDSAKRGIWTLTDKGLRSNLKKEDVFVLFKKVQSSFKKIIKKDETATEKNDEIEERLSIETNYRQELLQLLQSLSPGGFEKICRRLLTESGLEQVEVTGRSGDGGIDGHGLLTINPLVSFKVIFQCKRYQGSVTPSQVRDFRGAMQGRADKGIIFTTGNFTPEAKKEAIRDGVPPIELVDGDKLITLFEKYEIGLKPKQIYEIDLDFFEHYK